MNHMDDIHDSPVDESFEARARSAGRSLRRDAPAHVLRDIRRRTQNQRRVRVAGATALTLAVVAIAGLAVSRGGHEQELVGATDPTNSSLPTTEAPTTEATTPAPGTEPTPATTEPPEPTTTAPTSVSTTAATIPVMGVDLHEWLAAQASAGATRIDIRTNPSTTARLFVPLADANEVLDPRTAAVELEPGRLVVVPPELLNPLFVGYDVFGLGDRVAVALKAPAGGISMLVLDPITGEWTPGPALPQFDAAQYPDVIAVGGSLVVTSIRFGPDATIAEHIGVVVRPDLTVADIAAPPDGALMHFDAAAGSKVFVMGWDDDGSPNTVWNLWSYDIDTGTWAAVPNPDWLSCAPASCAWYTPHEGASPFLAAEVGDGLVVRTPDGSIGRLDPTTNTWRRLDDAPVVPSGPDTATLDDHTLVVVPFAMASAAAVLDVDAGAWRTIPITVSTEQAWPQFVGDDASLLIGFRYNPPGTANPVLAIDRATGQPRPPTEADAALWAQHAGGTFDVAELLGGG